MIVGKVIFRSHSHFKCRLLSFFVRGNNFSDVKDRSVCPKCGGELQDYVGIEKSDQIEKNKKLERYYKFEKEWLKMIKKQGSEK